MASRQAKVDMLEARQKAYQASKSRAHDLQSVRNDMRREAASNNDHHTSGHPHPYVSSGGGGGGGGGVGGGGAHDSLANPELLDRLTERISQRVHAELSILQPQQQHVMADKMAGFLESELCHTHNCQICYEVMVPPHRTPMLLFPCGHTFCRACLDSQKTKGAAGAAARCPLCRQPISSSAENHSLRQLIERFVQQKETLERGEGGDMGRLFPTHQAELEKQEQQRCSAESSRYQAEYQAVSMRHRILTNELGDVKEALGAIRKKKRGGIAVRDHLLKERADVEARMARLREELELIESHVSEQEAKIEETRGDEEAELAKVELIEQTLRNLELDMDKASLIGGVEPDGGGEGGGFCEPPLGGLGLARPTHDRGPGRGEAKW